MVRYEFDLSPEDFEVAHDMKTEAGKFIVSMSPILRFGVRIVQALPPGKGIEGKKIRFWFQKDGEPWGGIDEDMCADSVEFYKKTDRMDYGPWILSRGWFLRKFEWEKKLHEPLDPMGWTSTQLVEELQRRRRVQIERFQQLGYPDRILIENEALQRV